MAKLSIEQDLISALEGIETIDAHEHLFPEKMRNDMQVDVFTLFSNYSDLGIAGMPSSALGATGNTDIPVEKRWRLTAPYWEHKRWTSYARAILLTIKKFYGVDDINEKTSVEISEQMAADNKPGLYHRVLREACNIRTSLTQCGRTEVDKPLLLPVMPLMTDVETWEQVSRPIVGDWETYQRPIAPDITVRTLDDLLDAHRSYIRQMKAEGAVGLKTVSNPYGDPDRKAAQECFDHLRLGTEASLPAPHSVNPLRTYVMDEMLRYAGEQDLTVAVHTGYWGDFRQLGPLHMIPIIQRHPEVRFDIYHLGFPWVRETLMLGKGFANVWINFCWDHIISQRIASDALDEAIDLLPRNKVVGFGGDFVVPVELAYGHMVMARENIARTLARRIESGQMDKDQALDLARRWLFDNPKELYRLEV